MKTQFSVINVLLSKIKGKAKITDPATGRQINITGDKDLVNVSPLRNPLQEYMGEMRNLADPAAKEIDIFLKTTNADGATFKDMSNLRKSINDTLYFGSGVSTKARMVLEGLRGQIDDMLDTQLIENFIPKNALKNKNDLAILKQLAKDRKQAMANFREGMQKYEKLAQLKIVRSVRDLQTIWRFLNQQYLIDL